MLGRGPADGQEKGVASRAMARLFTDISSKTSCSFRVGISCLQIYCETLQVLDNCWRYTFLCHTCATIVLVVRTALQLRWGL